MSSIRLNLDFNAPLWDRLKNAARDIRIAPEKRQGHNLHVVITAMIVFRGGFLFAFVRVQHPIQEPCTPAFHSFLVGGGPRLGAGEESNCIYETVNIARLNQPSAPSGVVSGDSLSEFQVRIHSRFGVQKPCAQ